MSDTKHSIRNSVIGGVLLALILSLARYMLGSWDNVFAALSKSCGTVAKMATSPVAVPAWAIAVVGLMVIAVVVLIVIVWLARPDKEVRLSRPPTSGDYFGIRWRWQYDQAGQIHTIGSFCPKCDLQMYAQTVYEGRYSPGVRYVCEKGDFQSGVFEQEEHALENRLIREIQRELRAKATQS